MNSVGGINRFMDLKSHPGFATTCKSSVVASFFYFDCIESLARTVWLMWCTGCLDRRAIHRLDEDS